MDPTTHGVETERMKEFKKRGLQDQLPQTLFQKNRAQFMKMFKAQQGEKLPTNAVGFFKGGSEVPMYSGDVPYPDYQEAFFYYLFGVEEMDCYGAIDFVNERSILFVPKLDNMYKIWMTVLSLEELKTKYNLIDEIRYVDEMETYFKELQPETVFINKGVNSDSGLDTLVAEDKYYKDVTKASTDDKVMHNILCGSRVIKNEEELDIMRWASKITCEAHCYTLKNCKVGMRESQLESFFNYDCQQRYFCGRVQPYHSICGCGPSAATLHYPDNNKWLVDGQFILMDQGHQVHHYVSDVTTSFPANGKFTEKQKEIYNIVLKVNETIFKNLKPGVNWKDMHLMAEKITLEGLKELGLVTGDIDEMMESRLGFVFQPHGLGHLIGLDVHDVGGYMDNAAGNATPERDTRPGLKNLRTARIMEPGMCITIEPGCYFRDFLFNGEIDPTKVKVEKKFLNIEKIKEYQKEVNGVRIEDVITITKDGCENLSNGVPRTVEEIEACMAGKEWRQ
eukprot:CAMPEP_0170488268 /NCGR_PEP_ID=MMETSP0208-20121228/6860_1 /TAXON_ID=197538 /ORGANISM="Strombidium inclinatum, Strain S3" /LENGTH=506 /DNA_ID=CAMNT_0010762791 /DNA_START=8 /DNA_END=1528 /DNA_ORIENTATION=-